MPFKVKFEIYPPGKLVPDMITYDGKLARIEYDKRLSKPGMALTRLVQVVSLTAPSTKSEEYLYLVYQVRKLERQYFSEGRNKEVFMQALAKEKELDNWNTRNRFHLQGHPKFTPSDTEAFNFFLLVEQWRTQWKDYFSYKKRADKVPEGIKLRSQKCRELEKYVDGYIRKHIGLL